MNIPLVVVRDDEVADGADVLVDGSIAGRPYRFRLDSGAARTVLVADEFLLALPAAGEHVFAGVFGRAETSGIVTVPELRVGDLVTGPLPVAVAGAAAGRQHVLGMDLLGRFCCHFRFGDQLLELTESPASAADLDLHLGSRQHAYVELCWPDTAARACWDSGGSISVVDEEFTASHPELFRPAGHGTGADSRADQAATPLMRMAGPVIAGVQFAASTVAVVDLGPVNESLESPMAIIAGYPLLSQADWLFDFPAARFAAPRLLRQAEDTTARSAAAGRRTAPGTTD